MRNAGYAADGQVSTPAPGTITVPLIGDEIGHDVPDLVTHLEATAQRRTTPCGPGHMLWRIWGEGPAVVLFHGAFGSWTHWLKSIAALSENHCVIVPDIPGFGDSHLPPPPHTADGLARILSDGLVELLAPGEPITFIGFSFGGQMAARCARNLRGRAGQVVLVASSNLGIARGRPAAMMGWRHLNTRTERDAAHRHNLRVMMIHDPAKIDADAIWVQRNNAERARLRDVPIESMRPALEAAGCAIAFVCGSEDPRCKPCLDVIIDTLTTIDAKARFALLEGQGHWLSWEAPEQLSAILLAFLDGDPAGLFADGSRLGI
jgi:2-hydroxy-6-oxonona-2,4-dienedioate hydrolase